LLTAFPVLAPLALGIAAQVEIWVGGVPGERWVLSLFALAWTIPLLFWRRWPLAAGVASVAAFAAEAYVEYPATENSIFLLVVVIWSLWLTGSHPRLRLALVAGAAGFALLVAGVAAGGHGVRGDDVAFLLVIGLSPWLASRAVRRRGARADELEDLAAKLERDREEQARAAVAAERARIAGELHEVVTNSVNAMTVQAEAARVLLRDDPERARRAVVAVEETGREALAETRRLLGILRSDMSDPLLAPQPGLGDLDRLVADMRARGLQVAVDVVGSPAVLAPGVDLAAYRIVQEALEGALAGSGRTGANVTVRYGEAALDLVVADDGRSAGGGREAAIAALRERLAIYGGKLEAGPGEDGRFSVKARIPTEASR
jgi:signal transduction histidine kinase